MFLIRPQAPVAFAPRPPVALGQAGCPSPIWYVVGGAVGWAILGDVLRGAGRVAGRGAQHGLSKIEKRIPQR
jgi:hypothetical protein